MNMRAPQYLPIAISYTIVLGLLAIALLFRSNSLIITLLLAVLGTISLVFVLTNIQSQPTSPMHSRMVRVVIAILGAVAVFGLLVGLLHLHH